MHINRESGKAFAISCNERTREAAIMRLKCMSARLVVNLHQIVLSGSLTNCPCIFADCTSLLTAGLLTDGLFLSEISQLSSQLTSILVFLSSEKRILMNVYNALSTTN